MLKGISPLISPELLFALARMGHGDEIVFADAHFPGESHNNYVVRADGLLIPDLLEAILPLFELDSYVPTPIIMMDAVEGDTLDSTIERKYLEIIQSTNPNIKTVLKIDRFDFYERSKNAFAIVTTGDTAKYANLILKKGVTTV